MEITIFSFLHNNGPVTIDKNGPRKQTSKSIHCIVCTIYLTINRDEEAVVFVVEVEEGEAVDAGVVVGKTIESASRRLKNATSDSKDTTTMFWDWKMRRNSTSGLH